MTAARKGYTCELLVLLQILSFNIKNTAKDKNIKKHPLKKTHYKFSEITFQQET